MDKEVAVEGEEEAAVVAPVEVEVMMMTMIMTTTGNPHLQTNQDLPDVDIKKDTLIRFSTMQRRSNNWLKSCKIKDKQLRDDASQASQPPILSRPPIRMDSNGTQLSQCMLRSEAQWFPRFIKYGHFCRLAMPEDEEGSVIQGKATLKRFAACDGYQQVQTILDAYQETATFSDLIYRIQFCSLGRLVQLLQEAKKRADNWKDMLNTLRRKYNNLHADYGFKAQ